MLHQNKYIILFNNHLIRDIFIVFDRNNNMDILFSVFISNKECSTSSNEQILIWHVGNYVLF